MRFSSNAGKAIGHNGQEFSHSIKPVQIQKLNKKLLVDRTPRTTSERNTATDCMKRVSRIASYIQYNFNKASSFSAAQHKHARNMRVTSRDRTSQTPGRTKRHQKIAVTTGAQSQPDQRAKMLNLEIQKACFFEGKKNGLACKK